MTEPNEHAFTGAYTLDALDDDEAASFRGHLLECESCPSEVAELRATAIRLFDAVVENPPPALRTRVLAAVDRTAQIPPLPVSLADRRDTGQRDTGRRDARRRRIVAATGSVLAAAAVAAGALFIVTADDPPTAAEVLAAADARVIPLADSTGEGPSAEVVLSASEDAAVLQMEGLPAPPEGQTYQAWVFEGDEPVPSATFEPTATGAVTEVLTDAAGATSFAVTVEPDGGSDTPTTEPVMVFEAVDA